MTPVHFLASFARSGETLMLRTLAAHPQIAVVHQIAASDDPRDFALFRRLQSRAAKNIDPNDEFLRHRELTAGAVLLLKYATWIHPHTWRGFVLVRNPFSVMQSCGVAADVPDGSPQHEQMERWSRDIDRMQGPYVRRQDILTGFCLLYARKMAEAYASGRPIVRYEDFVQDPETWLRWICRHMRLDWDRRLLTAHEAYPEGVCGHGGIRLWEPINAQSLENTAE